jgi:O-succinylbenzoate synthase
MKIDKIEVREVGLPLVRPFETSYGTTEMRRCVLVRLVGDGAEGWGEIPVEEWPGYGPETIATAMHLLRDVVGPLVVGREYERGGDVAEAMRGIRGHPMCRAGVESAAWDMECAIRGVSLAELLGSDRESVEVGISLGVAGSVDELLEWVGEAVESGYGRVKIKIKPGWDLDVVREVRGAFGDLPLMVDGNGAYSIEDAPLFVAMDEFGLMMIEQPLGWMDLVDHGRLQGMIETPLCLDESLRWRGDVEAALRLGACRVVNLKVCRVGGISEARAIHDLCVERGVPLWCGGLLETGIGRCHNLGVASLPGFVLAGDISESRRYYVRDLIDPPIRLGERGRIEVPGDPGVAGRLDPAEIDRRTLTKIDVP